MCSIPRAGFTSFIVEVCNLIAIRRLCVGLLWLINVHVLWYCLLTKVLLEHLTCCSVRPLRYRRQQPYKQRLQQVEDHMIFTCDPQQIIRGICSQVLK